MSAGFAFTASCPSCGGELHHRGIAVQVNERTTSAKAECDGCDALWRLVAFAQRVPRSQP